MKDPPPKGYLILALLLLFCILPSSNHARSSQATNFLVITVDTLRRDHLSCYGSSTTRTPSIDAIAKKGVVFDRFYTAANITMPSHLSIFSGTYPVHHGVYGNEPNTLSKAIPFLPAILRNHGYVAGGIASNLIFRINWLHNFGEQFDFYYAPYDRQLEQSASEATRHFGILVDSYKRRFDKAKRPPFFFWIHYFDPHVPYRPPQSYQSHRPIRGSKSLPELDYTRPPWAWLKTDGVTTIDRANALYSGEVSFVDAEIGKVWNLLQKESLLQDTVIVFVSDHGEMLGDHGVYYDHATLYDPTVHIPCFVYGKGFKAGRRSSLTSTVDIAPTILELAGVAVPPDMDGKSFLPLLTGREEKQIHSYVLSVHAGRHAIAVMTDQFKFMRNFRAQYDLKERALYDLNDPVEKQDLSASMPELAHDLETLIPADKPEELPPLLDPEQEEILKSLGYIQ